MKNLRKILAILMIAAMAVSLVACGGGDAPASSEAPTSESEASTPESEADEPESEAEDTSGGAEATPRNETLYYSGIQWGSLGSANPFSPAPNAFFMEQNDQARSLVYETLYMYNGLDGELYPLLADGQPEWNDDNTQVTVKIKPAAMWSDGTAVTAHDVAATFDMHIKHNSNNGVDYSQFIESVVATDDSTVVFTAITGDDQNNLKVMEYLPKVFVGQKAYLEALDTELGGDSEAFKTAEMLDAPHSGPYHYYFDSEEIVIIERSDDYWGQDASMWGALPVPKYIAHNIYANNAAGEVAIQAGQVDVSQQYIANVDTYWAVDGLNLPVSTYIDEAPYHLAESTPSVYFNTTREGLDQTAVRQAIAYATDYDQILTNAMTNQSPSFAEFPRSLFNPSAAEREIYDRISAELEPLQWVGKEYDRANKVLDDAGIVDTDNDGWREYNGEKMHFTVECPAGWSDWNAALDLVAAAGAEIGISMETYYPEAAVWTEDIQTGNFDLAMSNPAGASIANPWTRSYQLLYGFDGEFPERVSFSYSRIYDERIDEVLKLIPNETDQAKLDEYYLELNKFYLEQVPSFSVMYRPVLFQVVSETVWTGFPEEGDGTNIPPSILLNGYGIAGLYNIYLIDEAA